MLVLLALLALTLLPACPVVQRRKQEHDSACRDGQHAYELRGSEDLPAWKHCTDVANPPIPDLHCCPAR